MARLINLKTFEDERGNLTIIEKVIPFEILRIFYMYNMDNSPRGGHRHHQTKQAAICLKGKCRILCHDRNHVEEFILDDPGKCLILEPEDWHRIFDFSPDTILMVLASTYFNPDDYIYEPYQ